MRSALLASAALLGAAAPAVADPLYSYSVIDVPGSVVTQAASINDAGQVMGSYSGADGNFHGFRLSNGVYTTFDAPGGPSPIGVGINVPGAVSTYAYGINDAGQIVGYSFDGNTYHGFLRSSGGVYTAIDGPGASATYVFDINNAGQIVGGYDAAAGGESGFMLSGGVYTPVNVPGPGYITEPYGINDSGQIVGVYEDAKGEYSFLATPQAVAGAPEPTGVVLGLLGAGALGGLGFLRRRPSVA